MACVHLCVRHKSGVLWKRRTIAQDLYFSFAENRDEIPMRSPLQRVARKFATIDK